MTTTTRAESGGPVTTADIGDESGSLPATGSSQALSLVLGLALLLGGLIFMMMSRRPDETL